MSSYILRVIKIKIDVEILMIALVAISKSLKKTQVGVIVVAVVQERNSPLTQSCHMVVEISFLLEVAIGC